LRKGNQNDRCQNENQQKGQRMGDHFKAKPYLKLVFALGECTQVDW